MTVRQRNCHDIVAGTGPQWLLQSRDILVLTCCITSLVVRENSSEASVLRVSQAVQSQEAQAVEADAGSLQLASNPVLRTVYAGLGLLCVGLAIVGVILPGWPTTIWLLIAAWLFSKSSRRFYERVLNHWVFGPIVRDYRAGNGVPKRIKIIAITSIVLFAGGSALLLISHQAVRLAVVATAMFGIGFLVGLPVRAPYSEQQPAGAPEPKKNQAS